MKSVVHCAIYFLVLYNSFVFVAVSSTSGTDGSISDQWLVQKLDNFDLSSSRTWWQRYHTNETWFKNSRNAPIFLLIGGNSRIVGKSITEGAFMEYARRYNALTFQIEHRFYGESKPTNDFSVDNLRFLTVDQALADVAVFVQRMNSRYRLTANNKWVVFGRGYAGSLAAWARLKYPHLIYAAVSSSAPLQAESGHTGFDSNIWNVLSATKPSCPENIRQAALNIENILKTPGGNAILTSKFKRCNSLDTQNSTEVIFFIESLARHIRDAVEFELTHNASSSSPNQEIQKICTIMTDTKLGTPLDRYAAVNSLFTFNSLFTYTNCKDYNYGDYVSKYQEVTDFGPSRPWLYQRCSELGHFPISGTVKSLFGTLIDIEFYVNTCRKVFGGEFDVKRLVDGVAIMNTVYGGLNLETSRLISVGGTLDLWRNLGLRRSSNREMPVVIIDGAGFGADMEAPSSEDSTEVVNARNTVQRIIGEWLSSNYTSTM